MPGILRICSQLRARCLFQSLCKTSVKHTQAAFISTRLNRQENPYKLPPFPYKTKNVTLWVRLFDPMLARFDDNTKVVVVDGPIACGKTKVAEKLAEELEMLYFAPPSFDELYITEYGFDLRTLDSQLPPDAQTIDIYKFLTQPEHVQVNCLQHNMYCLRLLQYADALAHLLSTGQGVVLERSVYSDIVFMLAMDKAGYSSRGTVDVYYQMREATFPLLLAPHLCIYLDVSPERVHENIKKRGIPEEVNSKVLNMDYLRYIDHFYKETYLREIAKSSHVLMYNWEDEADMDVVFEDIEKLDFNYNKREPTRFDTWNLNIRNRWFDVRQLYADEKDSLLQECFAVNFDTGENLIMHPKDALKREEVYDQVPGIGRAYGFNKHLGETGLLWKWRIPAKGE